MHLLDSNAAIYPTITNTWFLSLAKTLFHKAMGSTKKEIKSEEKENTEVDDRNTDDLSSVAGSESGKSSTGKEPRMPTQKTGGKRRKAVPRKR